MKKSLLLLAAILGFSLGSLGMAGAATHQGPVVSVDNQKFDTSLVALDRPAGGAYEGTLNLSISPDGIVYGWFRDDRSELRTVTGGLDGDQIWLDIGSRNPLHISGTYRDGIIVGYAHLDQTYEFDAKPNAI